jgi:hypothetical protein
LSPMLRPTSFAEDKKVSFWKWSKLIISNRNHSRQLMIDIVFIKLYNTFFNYS